MLLKKSAPVQNRGIFLHLCASELLLRPEGTTAIFLFKSTRRFLIHQSAPVHNCAPVNNRAPEEHQSGRLGALSCREVEKFHFRQNSDVLSPFAVLFDLLSFTHDGNVTLYA